MFSTTLESECAKMDGLNDPVIMSVYGKDLVLSHGTTNGHMKQEELTHP
jgi:hypothetical protein